MSNLFQRHSIFEIRKISDSEVSQGTQMAFRTIKIISEFVHFLKFQALFVNHFVCIKKQGYNTKSIILSESINLSNGKLQKKSIQKMQEGMKQSGQSFLQKFKGKTNKISKHGIDHLMKQKLQPINKDIQYKSLESSRQIPEPSRNEKSMIKTPVTIESSKIKQAKRLAEDMEELFSHNPQFTKSRKIVLKKINHQHHSITNQKDLQPYSGQRKQRMLPPLYTPQKNYKRAISSNLQSFIDSKSFIDSNQNHRTNSQHGSAISQKKSKYVFGKYLKLDEDAMKHFEFLKNIEQRSLLKKNKLIDR